MEKAFFMNKQFFAVALLAAGLLLAGCVASPTPTPKTTTYATVTGTGTAAPTATIAPTTTPPPTPTPTPPAGVTAQADRLDQIKLGVDAAIQTALGRSITATYNAQPIRSYGWSDTQLNGNILLATYAQNSYGAPGTVNLVQINGKTVDVSQSPSTCRKGTVAGCHQRINVQCYNFNYLVTVDITEDTTLTDPTYPATRVVAALVPACPN